MILNTREILSEVTAKPLSESKNPLYLKEIEDQKRRDLQEKKLQEQVAMIFRDSKYFKPFQETALTTANITPPKPETPEEKAQRLKDDDIKKKKDKEFNAHLISSVARPLVATATGSLGAGLGAGLVNAGIGATVKGLTYVGKKAVEHGSKLFA